ncbi:MAG: hypothetical protein ACD_27C00032G0014 [uncultured bacterium]|nr:MAG: hypothetical protein ACD_27C00032G0014 [uncultured bacterium]KKU58559.1 MAG: hypothetical protein UX82_C0037G0004 [Microgenomates group bacterium GW2011_GWE1_47_12]
MSLTKLSSLSIFFPAYNEAANIEMVIRDALTYAPQVAQKFEIIIVDDGSTDGTASVIRKHFGRNQKVRLITHPKNLGYGAAFKTGLKSCRYKWIFSTDSDRQFHFSELPAFVKLRDRADVIVGWRKKRRDPLIRIIIAHYLLRFWNLFLFRLWMKDVDCAYKLIPSKHVKNLTLTTESAITVTEMMMRLKRQGLTFYEHPVKHYPRKYGLQTGNHPRVILRAFRESLKLWLNQK